MWDGSKSESRKTQKAIALVLFIQDIIGLGTSIEIQLRVSINFLGWPLNILLSDLLALITLISSFSNQTNLSHG